MKSKQNEITIGGELKKTIRIKGTGAVAWAVGAIGVAVIVALKTPTAGGPQATMAREQSQQPYPSRQ